MVSIFFNSSETHLFKFLNGFYTSFRTTFITGSARPILLHCREVVGLKETAKPAATRDAQEPVRAHVEWLGLFPTC